MIQLRRESVVWSGALRLRPIKRSSESRNPSVWRSGRLKTTRSVNAVRTARFEYRRWPPRRPFFGGTHAAIASSLSQIVTSPRLLRPRSYSLQCRILYFFLYWRLLSLDYVLEHPVLPWLPTEQEKVAFFDLLGIDRNRIPHRIYHGAVGKQTRYFALKLPIACDAKSATFVYIDPGNNTDTELRSWGAAHEWLWRALRGKGIKVQVVAIGLDFDDTIRSEAALKRWSKGAGKQVEQIAEGQTQDDPDMKAEMQLIENAILKVDTIFMAKYGGVQAASMRLLALRKLPKSKVEPEASIDSYEIWVSSRLRMQDVDL